MSPRTIMISLTSVFVIALCSFTCLAGEDDYDGYYTGDADFLNRLSTAESSGNIKIIKAKPLIGKTKSPKAKAKSGREVSSNVTVTTTAVKAARTASIVVQPVVVGTSNIGAVKSAVTSTSSHNAFRVNFGYKSGNFSVRGHIGSPGFYFHRPSYYSYGYPYGYNTFSYYSPSYSYYYPSYYSYSYYPRPYYNGFYRYRSGYGHHGRFGRHGHFVGSHFRVTNIARPTAKTIAHIR